MLRSAPVLALALLTSACIVGPRRVYVAPPPPVVVNAGPPMYRYWGEHPIPYAEGGGWCFVEGEHVHPYAISGTPNYVVTNQVYYYRGPPTCSYSGPHPVVGGGWCYLGYPHTHNYCPSPEYRANYRWEPRTRAFVYSAPPPGYRGPAPAYHGAAPVHP